MRPAAKYTVYIDGYNLAHRRPEWRRLRPEQARDQVRGLLAQTRWPFPSPRVVVVFDSASPEAGGGGGGAVRVRFAKSADAEIQQAIRDCAAPSRMAVVTDDAEILRTAKSHGVKMLSCEWVFQHSGNRPSTPRSSTHDDSGKTSLPAAQARSITEELERRWLKDRS